MAKQKEKCKMQSKSAISTDFKKAKARKKRENKCTVIRFANRVHFLITFYIPNKYMNKKLNFLRNYLENRLYLNKKDVYTSLRIQAFSKYNELIVQDENGVTFDINKNERLAYERGLEDAYKDILNLLNR